MAQSRRAWAVVPLPRAGWGAGAGNSLCMNPLRPPYLSLSPQLGSPRPACRAEAESTFEVRHEDRPHAEAGGRGSPVPEGPEARAAELAGERQTGWEPKPQWNRAYFRHNSLPAFVRVCVHGNSLLFTTCRVPVNNTDQTPPSTGSTL